MDPRIVRERMYSTVTDGLLEIFPTALHMYYTRDRQLETSVSAQSMQTPRGFER